MYSHYIYFFIIQSHIEMKWIHAPLTLIGFCIVRIIYRYSVLHRNILWDKNNRIIVEFHSHITQKAVIPAGYGFLWEEVEN